MMPQTGGPAAPRQPDPVRIPSPDDPDLIAARRQRMRDEYNDREGRQSTMLSPGTNGAYSRTALG